MTTPYQASPVLPPSPMTVGQAISSAVTIVRQRLGLFALLALLPGLAAGIIIAIAFALTAALAAASMRSYYEGPNAGAVVGMFVVWLVAMVAAIAVEIKANGMITLLAHETALGRRPDFNALNTGTRGIVQRTLLLMVVATVAGVVIGFLYQLVVLGGFLVALGGTSDWGSSSGPRGLEGFAGAVMLMMVLGFGLSIASMYLTTRWIYFNQALAVEGRDGFAALGRSWQLTRNEFWRTLGWYLLGSIIVAGVTWVIMLVFSLFTSAISGGGRSGINAGAGAVATILFLITFAVVMVLIVPAMMSYTTVMYIDQQRRLDPSAVAAGPLGAPAAFYGQPAQPQYGAPQYGTPQDGTPQYGAPDPAQWTPPGQQYGQPPQQGQPQRYYGVPGQPSPYGAPSQPSPYGAPGDAANPYGSPGSSSPYGTPGPNSPYGTPPEPGPDTPRH